MTVHQYRGLRRFLVRFSFQSRTTRSKDKDSARSSLKSPSPLLVPTPRLHSSSPLLVSTLVHRLVWTEVELPWNHRHFSFVDWTFLVLWRKNDDDLLNFLQSFLTQRDTVVVNIYNYPFLYQPSVGNNQ